MKHFFRTVWAALIYIGLFSLFALTRIAVNANKTVLKPMFSFVSSVATDGNHIYTLDDFFNRICVYTSNGELISVISFDSHGSNHIFCNNKGNLCRFDERSSVVSIYDDHNNVLSSHNADLDDLLDAGVIEVPCKTSDSKGNLQCRLNNHIFFPSSVSVKTENANLRIVTENMGFHLYCLAFIVLIISFFVYIFLTVIDIKRKSEPMR